MLRAPEFFDESTQLIMVKIPLWAIGI